MYKLIISDDAADGSLWIAEKIIEVLSVAIAKTGRGSLVLAGGSTYKVVYHLLANKYSKSLDWSKVTMFLGDERMVAEDDDRSNLLMIKKGFRELFQITPISLITPLTKPSANQSAKKYEQRILAYFNDEQPHFDVVLLGVGPDGHTASIFSGSLQNALSTHHLVIATKPELAPLVDRVTLSFKAINQAKNVILMITGESKSKVAKALIKSDGNYPVNYINPGDGNFYLVLDQAATL